MSATGTINRKILIVEDDRDIRDTVEQILLTESYQVYTAGNGREALDLLETGTRPDLILLDLTMPVMTGQEFLLALRQNGNYSALPVIVTSAAVDRFIAEQITAFLRKPLNLDALLDTVAKSFRIGT
jgi:CheY-like chemotaxis protein